MRQQLRARDERMQMMLAGIAHEVRNPLGGMELYAGLLRDELAGDAEKLAHVAAHRARARPPQDHRHRFPRVRAPAQARRSAPCDVAELLAEVRDIAVAAAQPRNVRAGRARRRRRRASPCDAGQLRRALAQPRAERGAGLRRRRRGRGHARLRARRRRGARHRARHRRRHRSRRSSAKIWTPFYTTKQSGTGLGLAFVRDIARDHGARLAVDSAPAAAPPSRSRCPEATWQWRRSSSSTTTRPSAKGSRTSCKKMGHLPVTAAERQGRPRALQADAAPTSSSPISRWKGSTASRCCARCASSIPTARR